MLELYEDALEFADKALMLQQDHQKSLFRKGKALMFLFEFKKAEEIFKITGNKDQLEVIRRLQLQRRGDYSHVISNYNLYHNTPTIINYAYEIEIKMVAKYGRGIFATKKIPYGTLIIAEKHLGYAD